MTDRVCSAHTTENHARKLMSDVPPSAPASAPKSIPSATAWSVSDPGVWLAAAVVVAGLGAAAAYCFGWGPWGASKDSRPKKPRSRDAEDPMGCCSSSPDTAPGRKRPVNMVSPPSFSTEPEGAIQSSACVNGTWLQVELPPQAQVEDLAICYSLPGAKRLTWHYLISEREPKHKVEKISPREARFQLLSRTDTGSGAKGDLAVTVVRVRCQRGRKYTWSTPGYKVYIQDAAHFRRAAAAGLLEAAVPGNWSKE